MFDLLEKIRQKPERTRKQIAFLISLSVSGLIFVVWLSVIYPSWRFSKEKEEKIVTSEPSPISTVASTFYSTVNALGEQFSNLKEAFSQIYSNPTYYVATTTDEGVSTSSTELIEIIN
jgi:hypothetical protein